MGALSNLEPARVFYYFEELTKIPHGSGNVDRISDYLAEFGRAHGLFTVQDELKNVIFKKPAAPGYEGEEPLILQGHMDMVAVSKPDYDIDMRTQGLKAYVDGDFVRAEGTSLGGDDGIAVAYALALLESDEIPHPPLEVILTTDEEVGMDGARGIDLSCLEGHRLLNLDSEDEGIFLTGCAGGARVTCLLPLAPIQHPAGAVFSLRIGGLQGGHSGNEIDKERANSNILAGRLLYELARAIPGLGLIRAEGGLADNAIPRETVLEVFVPEGIPGRSGQPAESSGAAGCVRSDPESQSLSDSLQAALDRFRAEAAAELATKDPGVFLEASPKAPLAASPGSPDTPVYDAIIPASFLLALPNGVQAMSADVPGLVETSLNLGILKTTEFVTSENPSGDDGMAASADSRPVPCLHAEFSVRSSIESAKASLIDRLRAVTALAGGSVSVAGDYPGWKYRKDSPLREKMIAVFREMYGREPKVEAIHAGLECGLLGSKLEDLDCVSIGPDLYDIHTTEEHLSISSAKRVWEYLLRLLETKG